MRADDTHAPIVTGYDGSRVSEAALIWAAREAQARYAPLVVCHGWQWPFPTRPGDPSAMETVKALAEHTLGKGIDVARRHAPGVTVRGWLELGSASAVLLVEGAAASMIVLGARGVGGFEGLRLGATAVQVVAHAWCPVVVVPGPSRMSGRIVVGVDDSHGETVAMAFAFEQAALHRVPLHAVRAWEEDETARRAAAAHFHRLVSAWSEKFPYVSVTTAFVGGSPAEVLLDAARTAGLVVLGNHPRREGAEATIGMVTQAVLLGAPCPVAVVRPLPH
ncbi:Nucleotide-binding universal stress protein, UspA family [Sinosporangium album]|uniref:Nucleotide-binding universal stress protein, UspA family n=1 Tax=Sinosporangium album TaxID=504805 RepID=A0A1G8G2E9_9ACTN|nr:universal stress protein [Sinosporangium album]SDH88480.1 Nucleotide-binding universal stress protein, UspA family [Sinosporangium album]